MCMRNGVGDKAGLLNRRSGLHLNIALLRILTKDLMMMMLKRHCGRPHKNVRPSALGIHSGGTGLIIIQI